MLASVCVMFSTTGSLFSATIRALSWSEFSHCAIVDGDSIIEAHALHGVIRTPMSEAVARNRRTVLVDLPCVDPQAVIDAAAGQIGKPYDWTAILGLGLSRDWQNDDAWFCSELVAWSFDAGGSPLFRRGTARRVTPQHLWMLAPVEE